MIEHIQHNQYNYNQWTFQKYFMSYLFHYTAMSIQLFQSYVTKTFKPFTRPGVIPITKLFKQLHFTAVF